MSITASAEPAPFKEGEEATRFLKFFFPKKVPIFVCSYANSRDEARKFPPRDEVLWAREKIVAFRRKYDVPGRAVYFAVNIMRGDKRGKDEVASIIALHVDIDFKGVIEDRKTIEATLRKLPCPPTCVVFSGHGLHAYWIYEMPLGPENVPSHEDRLRRLCEVLAGDKSAAEVSRVMRLPGSRNTKDGDNIPVEFLRNPPPKKLGPTIYKRYSVAELDIWLDRAEPVLTYKATRSNVVPFKSSNPFIDVYYAERARIGGFDAVEAIKAMQFHSVTGNGIDDTYMCVIGAMVRNDKTIEEVLDFLLEPTKEVYERDRGVTDAPWNERRAENEIREKYRRLKRRDEKKAASEVKTANESVAARPNIITVRASQIVMRPKQWLWPGRLLRGGQEMLSGQPGLGKSQLQIDLKSRATRGADWPDGAPGVEPMSVIMLTAEDALDQEVVPRLHAAGADLDGVHIVKAIRKDKKDRQFLLGEDLDGLKELIRELGDIGLITIDPITAYMGGKIDSHKTTEVRSQLGPLKDLAEETNTAISTITHPPKGSGARAIDSFIGSQAFIAACRIGHLCIEEFEYDEETREKTATGRVLFCDVKNNAARKGATLAYRVEEVTILGPNGFDIITAPHIVWEKDAVNVSADDALNPGGGEKRGRKSEDQPHVQRFLFETLKDGKPVPVKTIFADGEALGFTKKQIRTASDLMGIEAIKGGFDGGWTWNIQLAKPRPDRTRPKPLPVRTKPK